MGTLTWCAFPLSFKSQSLPNPYHNTGTSLHFLTLTITLRKLHGYVNLVRISVFFQKSIFFLTLTITLVITVQSILCPYASILFFTSFSFLTLFLSGVIHLRIFFYFILFPNPIHNLRIPVTHLTSIFFLTLSLSRITHLRIFLYSNLFPNPIHDLVVHGSWLVLSLTLVLSLLIIFLTHPVYATYLTSIFFLTLTMTWVYSAQSQRRSQVTHMMILHHRINRSDLITVTHIVMAWLD